MGSIKKFGGKLKYNIFYKIWDNSCIIDPNIMSWSLLISETHFFLQAILLVISEKKKNSLANTVWEHEEKACKTPW